MKIDRLVSIIMILLEKKRVGARQLAEMFEVSPRTVYRDIDSITMAGIPVLSTSGAGGGFEIMEKYKIDKKVFSTADLSAILTGLSGLSGIMRGDALVNALAKVRSFIPAEKARDIAFKVNQIHIDLSPWMANRNVQACLELIKTALHESRLLSFAYADRHGKITARTAEPYQLVLKGSHWYWYGYCLKRKDFRLFRISRTSHLRIRDRTFKPREFQTPELDFSGMLAGMQTWIKIRFHKSIMERVLDYCPHEQLKPDGDAHYIARFPFIENDYYYNILLGFGEGCECLEPAHVRAGMERRVQALAGMYAKPGKSGKRQ